MGGTDLAGTLRHFIESYILTAMVLGAVVANLATHHDRPFRAIKAIVFPKTVAGATKVLHGIVTVVIALRREVLHPAD